MCDTQLSSSNFHMREKDVCEQGDARQPVEPQRRRTEARVISNLICRIYDVLMWMDAQSTISKTSKVERRVAFLGLLIEMTWRLRSRSMATLRRHEKVCGRLRMGRGGVQKAIVVRSRLERRYGYVPIRFSSMICL